MKTDAFANKRVLITGGAGFIGSAIACRLAAQGAEVTVVDSMIPEYGGNTHNLHEIQEQIHFNIADVRDAYAMRYLVKDQDYLFNLAGQTSHMDSMRDPVTDLDINAKAQLSILESCRLYNPAIRIVFASTRQIYGKPRYLPVDEKHTIDPVDVNGINKTAGEWYHQLYHQVYGIPVCVLRLTNTYGPGMRIKDARQTFVGIWIRCLLEKQAFEVWGGEQLRDFNFVDDVIDAFLLAAIHNAAIGNTFNLGSEEVVSLIDLAELMAAVGEGNFVIKSFPEDRKKIDIGDYYSDYSLIQQALGWVPKTKLRQGLEQTLSYYRENFDKYI